MVDKDDAWFEPQFELVSDELLHCARHGNTDRVLELILESGSLDVNCRGTKKFNRGWTPLHLASYFGHYNTVKTLLENGADVNMVNIAGDTPLHQASHTGREKVLTVLLEHGADVTLANSESQQAKDLARNHDVRRLIEAAEHHGSQRHQEEFLQAAAIGNVGTITEKLKHGCVINVNCTDRFGNTALHISALRDQREVAVLLLQNGIDKNIKNKNDQLAADMARTQPMKQVLGVQGIKSLQLQPQRLEGFLLKKSRIMGFRPVWIVLERGVLSYFENRGDASTGSKRKGMKYLDEAKIMILDAKSREIKIAFSDGTSHTLCADALNGTQITKQKWLNALKEHIAFSTHYTHQGEMLREDDGEEMVPLGTMQDVLQTAQAHQKLLERKVTLLSKMVDARQVSSSGNKSNSALRNGTGELQSVYEEVLNIQSSSRQMCSALSHCMTLFKQQEEVRQLQLKEEMEKSRVLQDALHALATEHHELEMSITTHRPSNRYYDTDDDEFYDCSDDDVSVGSPRFSESFADAISNDFDFHSNRAAPKPWGSTS